MGREQWLAPGRASPNPAPLSSSWGTKRRIEACCACLVLGFQARQRGQKTERAVPPGAVARTFLSLFLSQWGPEQKVPVSTGASRGSAVSLPLFPEGPSGAVWAREGTWGPQPLVTSGMEARCPSSLSWNSPCQRVSVRTVSHPVAGRRGRAGCSCRLAEARSSARSPRSRRHGVRGRGPGLCRRPGGTGPTRTPHKGRSPSSPPALTPHAECSLVLAGGVLLLLSGTTQ